MAISTEDSPTSGAPGTGSTHSHPPPVAERTGLLIVRTWIEPGSPERLRAQVRLTSDLSAGIERSFTLARIDEVTAMVQEWLEATLGSSHDEACPPVPGH